MTGSGPQSSGDVVAADAIRQMARSGAPDRYLAALLAPRAARDDLITLAAFSAEIEKIVQQMHDPYIGEIRIQWWRDALGGVAQGVKSGHPVGDAFAAVMVRHALDQHLVDGYLDAATDRLFADPPATEEDLDREIDATDGALFALAAHILGVKFRDADRGLVAAAGRAYGLARIATDLPYSLARGRAPLPDSMLMDGWSNAITHLKDAARLQLAHARAAYRAAPVALRAAVLPAALVEPYLRLLSRSGRDPEHDIDGLSPLTRTWWLAKSHMTGRL